MFLLFKGDSFADFVHSKVMFCLYILLSKVKIRRKGTTFFLYMQIFQEKSFRGLEG